MLFKVFLCTYLIVRASASIKHVYATYTTQCSDSNYAHELRSVQCNIEAEESCLTLSIENENGHRDRPILIDLRSGNENETFSEYLYIRQKIRPLYEDMTWSDVRNGLRWIRYHAWQYGGNVENITLLMTNVNMKTVQRIVSEEYLQTILLEAFQLMPPRERICEEDLANVESVPSDTNIVILSHIAMYSEDVVGSYSLNDYIDELRKWHSNAQQVLLLHSFDLTDSILHRIQNIVLQGSNEFNTWQNPLSRIELPSSDVFFFTDNGDFTVSSANQFHRRVKRGGDDETQEGDDEKCSGEREKHHLCIPISILVAFVFLLVIANIAVISYILAKTKQDAAEEYLNREEDKESLIAPKETAKAAPVLQAIPQVTVQAPDSPPPPPPPQVHDKSKRPSDDSTGYMPLAKTESDDNFWYMEDEEGYGEMI